jgi:hypothetical protein
MALRIGKFCGSGGDVWLRMQAAYDLWHATRRLAGEIATINATGPRGVKPGGKSGSWQNQRLSCKFAEAAGGCARSEHS